MKQRLTSGFTQAGVYARRQFCGNLEVYRPPEPLWNPRLREAATTLCAMRGRHNSEVKMQKNKFSKIKNGIIEKKIVSLHFLKFIRKWKTQRN